MALSGTKCNIMLVYSGTIRISWHGTSVTISWSLQPTPILAPNVIPLCTIGFAVPNVIVMIGLIQATAPNAVLYFYFGFILVTSPNSFPDSWFINLLGANAVFERSTDRELLITPGNSSNGLYDS